MLSIFIVETAVSFTPPKRTVGAFVPYPIQSSNIITTFLLKPVGFHRVPLQYQI